MPFEFAYTTTRTPETLSEKDAAFFQALGNLLRTHNLHDLLGVRVLGNEEMTLTLEISQGNCNVMVADLGKTCPSYVEALWTFDGTERHPGYCKTDFRCVEQQHGALGPN